jgi:hypothetical protein
LFVYFYSKKKFADFSKIMDWPKNFQVCVNGWSIYNDFCGGLPANKTVFAVNAVNFPIPKNIRLIVKNQVYTVSPRLSAPGQQARPTI